MRYRLLSLFFVCFSTWTALGQVSQVQYGKNRVQYHDDFKEWLQYESPNFITFWYGKSRNVGQAVVQFAEYDHDVIQNILEHRINNKIELIVYADITDLKQSNIGSEETFINTAGQTKIVGNKIFVYFNGDHNHLRQQIREGVATVYLNAMMFGSNLQEIVQNAVMMNLPPWFQEGLVSYVGTEWTTEMDNRLKDLLVSGEYDTFEDLVKDHPKLAGHSLWYYIGQNHGKSNVSNLLYLTRINRSVENGFLYVLGVSYRRVLATWKTYYMDRYKKDLIGRDSLNDQQIVIKNYRKLPLSQLKISPNGKMVAYAFNEIGKYKVYLQDLETGKREVVLKGGFRNAFQATDYNYPLIAWKPNSLELSIVYEKRDIIKLTTLDLTTKETISEDLDPQYQRLLSIDYIDNNKMAVSAIVNGFSDLFIYQTLNRQTRRITNDFYDDLDASVVNIDNKKGILFASNRQDSIITRAKMDSILPINTFDIFYYDLENNDPQLIQISNTPLANERNPIAIDSTWFAYTSDQSGINNRRTGYLEDVFVYNEQIIHLQDGSEIILHQDSTLTGIDSTLIDSINLRAVYEKRAFTHNHSNYTRSIIHQHATTKTNKLVEFFIHDNQYKAFIKDINPEKEHVVPYTFYQQQRLNTWQSLRDFIIEPPLINNEINVLEKTENNTIDLSNVPAEKQDTSKVDIDTYQFQSEFDEEETPAIIEIEEDEGKIILNTESDNSNISPSLKLRQEKKVLRFNPSRITPYRLKFRTDFVTTNIDNNPLFGGLDTYAGDKQEFTPQPAGILVKANFKDLFEDYQVEGGIRLPTTFNGAEYFLLFDDKKGRLDKRYAAYRRITRSREESTTSFQPRRTENIVLLGMAEIRYPLDIFRSLRASFTVRNDKIVQLATEKPTLAEPTINEQRIGLKIEYVFDNSLDVATNMKNGTRYKVYAEMVKRFQLQFLDKVEFEFDKGFMTVLGIDARHYQRLDKLSILAVRLAAATSFGSEKILYYLGGTDNWLFPKFNDEVPLPLNDEYAYQSLAPSLRGFRQNIRNGNSFVLINTELRVPIIRYLFPRKLRSSFLRNFQAVGFFDVGTAWQGITPFTSENPLNIVSFLGEGGSPVNVKVNYFRDPIVAAYGVGVRSMLFGYFLRLDYAWGIETQEIQKPRWHFSMGVDF